MKNRRTEMETHATGALLMRSLLFRILLRIAGFCLQFRDICTYRVTIRKPSMLHVSEAILYRSQNRSRNRRGASVTYNSSLGSSDVIQLFCTKMANPKFESVKVIFRIFCLQRNGNHFKHLIR